MKTVVILLVVCTTLVGLLVYVLSIRTSSNSVASEQILDQAALLTFDQATVYTCAEGSTIATAFKTNDTTVVEVSLPHVGPVVMTKDTTAEETKFSTETGYFLFENSNILSIEKDGEIVYRECTVGTVPEVAIVPSAPIDLVDTTWRWVETTFASGTPISPNNNDDFSITFAPDNRFSANTDCNNVGGAYATGPFEVLNFTDIISTRIACTGDTKEGEFVLQLEQVSSYKVSPSELIMILTSMDNSGQMRFVTM